MADKQQVLKGRKAVDTYREAHALLHQKPYYRKVHEDHTPLLEVMLGEFKRQGFNSIQGFFDASNELNYADDGVYEHNIYKFRKDLEMLGEPASNNSVELRQTEVGRELVIDERSVMDTSVFEHITMKHSAGRCPTNARVFVAGLGLSLVLLYLAELNRAIEIIVCEIDERVINLLKSQVTSYLLSKYPNFNLRVIRGDALKKVLELGKFDWAFFDLNLPEEQASIEAETILTEGGVFTDWQAVKRNLREGWWR